MYSKVIAVLPSATHGYLSFSRTADVDTMVLDSGENDVKVYADSGAGNGSGYYVNVYGVTDPKNPACLAGNCYGSEDRIKLVIYQNKHYNNYRLFMYPGYSQTNDQWKNGFNAILKQAVIEMGDQNRMEIDTVWDLDTNRLLDHFPGYSFGEGRGGIFYDEFEAYIIAAEEDDRCAENNNGASLISKYSIRLNWIMNADPIPDADGRVRTIKLNRVVGLEMGDTVKIGPYNSSLNNFRITILDVDPILKSVLIGLTDTLSKGIPDVLNLTDTDNVTIYSIASANGITLQSCSCSKSSSGWDTHVHEFLHQWKVGLLEHVVSNIDRDNVMYPIKTDRTDTKLRYRSLPTSGIVASQSQWDTLHTTR